MARSLHKILGWLLVALGVLMTIVGILIFFLTKEIPISKSENGVVKDPDIYQKTIKDWHRIDLRAFSIETPQRFLFHSAQGIDSFVGMISDGNDSLYFDYGWYSNSFKNMDTAFYLVDMDTVNGKYVKLLKPKKVGEGLMAVYVRKAYDGNKFNLVGHGFHDEVLFFKIVSSLRFPDSDTSINSKAFAQNFSVDTGGPEKIFDNNCATCHRADTRTLTGPGLSNFTSQEIKDWFFKEDLEWKSRYPDPVMGLRRHRDFFHAMDTASIRMVAEWVGQDFY